MLMGHNQVINHVINRACIVVSLKRTLTKPLEKQTFQCVHVQILTPYYHRKYTSKSAQDRMYIRNTIQKKKIVH